MATMKTLNGYGFNATEFNGKAASDYLQKTDTATNSAKLGGKAPEYYIQPRNLLDNSDFRNPVNQRGKSEYSNVAYTYTIDRWKTLDSGSVTVANGYIVTTNHLVQFMPKNLNGIYTAAAKMLDGTLLIASGAIDTLSIGDGNTIQAGNDRAMSYFALRKAGSFLWAALYEGSYTAETLPPYVPKGYAAELAECQRYYYQSFSGSSARDWDGAIIREAISANRIADVSFPQTMRIEKPTITLYSPVSGGVNKISEYLSDTDVDAEAGYRSRYRFMLIRNTSEFEIGKHYAMHYTVSDDL